MIANIILWIHSKEIKSIKFDKINCEISLFPLFDTVKKVFKMDARIALL